MAKNKSEVKDLKEVLTGEEKPVEEVKEESNPSYDELLAFYKAHGKPDEAKEAGSKGTTAKRWTITGGGDAAKPIVLHHIRSPHPITEEQAFEQYRTETGRDQPVAFPMKATPED